MFHGSRRPEAGHLMHNAAPTVSGSGHHRYRALDCAFSRQVSTVQKTQPLLVAVLGEGVGVEGQRRGSRAQGKDSWCWKTEQPLSSNRSFCRGDVTALLSLSLLIYQTEVRAAAASLSCCEDSASCVEGSRGRPRAGTQQTATIIRPGGMRAPAGLASAQLSARRARRTAWPTTGVYAELNRRDIC